MIMLQSGDVLYIHCRAIRPYPKDKYAVCICPKFPLFFYINTEPRTRYLDSEVSIKKSDLPRLSHDSYIDTTTPVTFETQEIDAADEAGKLPGGVKQQIIEVVKNHDHLPPRHEKLVFNNFKKDTE